MREPVWIRCSPDGFGVPNVMHLIVALLLVQIVAVWLFGLEPARRRPEDLQVDENSPSLPVKI
jgi:putative MFS transporter